MTARASRDRRSGIDWCSYPMLTHESTIRDPTTIPDWCELPKVKEGGE